MPTYNFTSDLRISMLPERIQAAATEIINQELSSDKSASNNRATLAFYFNLIEGTNTLKLAANGSITEVVRNFVRKFQFPNTYTADLFNQNIEENILIAPLRETVKLLAYQFLFDGDNNPYLTYDEIRYYIFGNPDSLKGATANDYKKILDEIHKNRNIGHKYTAELTYLLNWKQYDRQSRELISVIQYACDSFKTLNGKLILLMPDPLSDKFPDTLHFIASVMNDDQIWIPSDKIFNQSIKDSYISYMDINGEVELCQQSIPSRELPSKSQVNKPLQIIYYGAPGTGKSHNIDNDSNVTDENIIRTTFHPDSDYSTFVGAYKPSKGKKPRYELNQDKTVRLSDENNNPLEEDVIVYQFTPQAFLKAYIKAWKNIDRPFFLVIEEINRGNCAQIFGDLFQLLDRNAEGFSSYAIDADEDIRKFIVEPSDEDFSLKDIEIHDVLKPNGKLIASGEDIKNGEKLVLPKNLYIWATMNTSDQSLFPIDSAFKRRWEWKYTPISEGIDSISGEKLNWIIDFSNENTDEENQINWWQFIRSINELVETTTGSEDKKLGYFFCKANADGKISSETFLSKVIFYLWNDVFRDYGFNSEVFKLLSDKAIKFHQFYNADGTPNKELLMNFSKKVIATYDPIKKEEKTVNETAD